MVDQLPTPGVGIVERIFLYTFLLWIGVLGVALLRQHGRDPAASRTVRTASAAR
jgi:hypothetical protein